MTVGILMLHCGLGIRNTNTIKKLSERLEFCGYKSHILVHVVFFNCRILKLHRNVGIIVMNEVNVF
jgi:hypothetical protein